MQTHSSTLRNYARGLTVPRHEARAEAMEQLALAPGQAHVLKTHGGDFVSIQCASGVAWITAPDASGQCRDYIMRAGERLELKLGRSGIRTVLQGMPSAALSVTRSRG